MIAAIGAGSVARADEEAAPPKRRSRGLAVAAAIVPGVIVRQGSFASSREAHRLLARLAAGAVDLTSYGHLHTYIGFENAGIPAHISGGGGAEPMLWDGIDRHFLTVDVAPQDNAITAVTVVRVD